ncbi:protein argonaute 16-like isoform X2 [Chenopodium quinoa]|uniref:protein argonaute 16-like isoform X2 n=1 Tax=Chenopodium quinoa TaxID=63459 RepID=UPI000B7800B1|nr:protein argonaute 16-like isoform X2 [Chenopodium quinoa]
MIEGQNLESDHLQLSPPSHLPPFVSFDGMEMETEIEAEIEAEIETETETETEIEIETKTETDSLKHQIMRRPGFGSAGRHISLLVNHLKVSIESPDVAFYQYSVKITSEDCKPIESKAICVKIIDKLFQIHSSKLDAKKFAFDGKENLYTVGPLPQKTSDFTLTYEESIGLSADNPIEPTKKSKHSLAPKLFKVELNYCREICVQPVAVNNEEHNLCETEDALRVINTILRQRAINKGCLLVRQSFFHDDSRNFFEIDGGLVGLRGLDSSFHMTSAGLSLNLDVAMTLILKPGPILDFLLTNQNVLEPRYIDWEKAKRMLKNLRIKTSHTNKIYKIIGLSDKPCYKLSFQHKAKKDSGSNEDQFQEMTVFEYFRNHCGVVLTFSKYTPCLDVGKPDKPIYLPIEVCSLISLQRYRKLLSPTQRITLLEKTKLKPHDRMKSLIDAVKNNQYENDPLLVACGISIEKQFMQIAGRVLEPPKLKVGRGQDCMPEDGRWNFKNKQFLDPVNIKCWAIVNFSSNCDTSFLSRELINCGRRKGMDIERPYALVEENQQMKKASPLARVDAMFEKLQDKLPDQPEFILCVLPDRKVSNLYGPWKLRSLSNFGLVTQCVCPVKITERYLTNVLIKINAKLGGMNSLLAIEEPCYVPHVKDIPTMIVGMDVSHGSPGSSDPSIAAVVGSVSWPLISRYRAAVRAQSPRTEIIDTLFKQQDGGEDTGIMRELLKDFFVTSEGRKPKQIIVFRDGVSDSQFSQVLDIELEQIKQAYLGLGEAEIPKFTVIVAQKRHRTRLFEVGAAGNVTPGTVVDTEVVHPRKYDFYMCAHGGMIGTLRPVHYHVLLDEIGFSPDELQNFIHSLSYVYQRSSHATSVVAPISYAHHAARQVGQIVRCDELPENSTENNGFTSAGSIPVPELPRLHDNVKDTMFFC